MSDTPHFLLGENERCPHLDGNGLCRIILELGEEYLCDICREHPRFYNYTSVAEGGIGMSCTEAARVILSSPDYAEMVCVGKSYALPDENDFDGRAYREEIYRILQDRSRVYSDRLDGICAMFSMRKPDDGAILGAIDALEYLDESHRALFKKYSSARCPEEYDEYRERLFAYYVYRHCTEASDHEDFLSRLSLCLFCEHLFASLICTEKANGLDEIAALARIISEEIEYSDENTAALLEL
jgi:lysine-N-methylase